MRALSIKEAKIAFAEGRDVWAVFPYLKGKAPEIDIQPEVSKVTSFTENTVYIDFRGVSRFLELEDVALIGKPKIGKRAPSWVVRESGVMNKGVED